MKTRDRRLRKEKGEVNGGEIEERYGEVKSMDRRSRKSTGVEVKGQKIEEIDGC